MMKRAIVTAAVGVMLSACAPQVDPCTADPSLPYCRTQKAVADATISAIDLERAGISREATRQAKASEMLAVAQATQAAGAAQATQIAVAAQATKTASEASAQATKTAIELEALKQQVVVSATISAITVDTAKVKAGIELSTTQLIGKSQIDQKQMEADTTIPRTAGWLALVAFVVGVVGVSLAMGVRRVSNAVANRVEVLSGLVTHGNHAWLVSPEADGVRQITGLTAMLGDHTSTDGRESMYQALDEVPQRERLAAAMQVSKHRTLVDVASQVKQMPEYDTDADEQQGAPLAWSIPTQYQVVEPAERPQLLAGIPQAEAVLDAEWRKLESGG